MKQNKIWHLTNFNIFQGITDEEMENLSEMMKTDRLKRLDPVYLQGDPSNWIYFLKEGLVKLDMISENGKSVTITLLKPGEIFGELSLEEQSSASTEAVAMEDCYLCKLSRERFLELMSVHQQMMLSVNKLLGLRIRKVQMAVQDLIFLDVPGRLAKLFYTLGQSDRKQTSKGHRINIRLTHQELGNLIGATREMVSLVIGRMEKEGLVLQEKRRFVIPNRQKLQGMFER